MVQSGPVLSLPERVVAAALVVVLGGAVAATAAGPLDAAPAASGPTSVRLQADPSPTPRREPLPTRSIAGRATAAARPTTPVADRVLGPVPPAPPTSGCPVPPRRATRPGSAPRPRVPAVPDRLLPAPVPAGAKAPSLTAAAGKGIWTTNFAADRLDVTALVSRARSAGLKNIWVRTGGRTGYYGDRVLPTLVPAAHAAGLTVVAWDFPYLSDPVADARRAERAFADGADVFAPDVETPAEGTFSTDRRVRLYLSLVRRAAGTRIIAATVPRPTPKRLATFPYAAFVPYADLFAPMIYWSCNEPGALVVQSLSRLGRLLPVAPVGQAYDMGSEGGRRGLPSRRETQRFLDVAKRGGAVGASPVDLRADRGRAVGGPARLRLGALGHLRVWHRDRQG